MNDFIRLCTVACCHEHVCTDTYHVQREQYFMHDVQCKLCIFVASYYCTLLLVASLYYMYNVLVVIIMLYCVALLYCATYLYILSCTDVAMELFQGCCFASHLEEGSGGN